MNLPIILIISSVISNCTTLSIFPVIKDYLIENNIKLAYFFTCWNSKDNVNLLKQFSENSIRITFVTSKTKKALSCNEITTYGYVIDKDCVKFRSLLEKKTFHRNFRLTYPWLLLSNNNSIWEQYFKNIQIRLDSNVRIIIPEYGNHFKLLEVYNPGFGLGGSPKISEIGHWSPNGGLFINETKTYFYLKRIDMSEINLRSGTVVLNSNHSGTLDEYMKDVRTKQYDTMSKFSYQLFLILKDVHKFRHFTIIKPVWFGNLSSGIDDGVCKLLYEEQIDITETGASQRPPRIDVVDYLQPAYRFRPIYIFRNPGYYNPLANEFLKPFSRTTWYVLMTFIILICFFIKLSFQIENKFRHLNRKYSWITFILITICVVFQQGSFLFPSYMMGGRIVFLALLVMSILIYNYYTSTIISILLNQPVKMLSTLDELGHSNLDIGVEDLPYTFTWFKIINDSDVQYIHKYKVRYPNTNNFKIYPSEIGMAKVAEGGFAYHTQADTGYTLATSTFNQEQICDLAQIEMIPPCLAGMMIQKKSQYGELFQITLRKAKTAGLIKRFSLIWETDKPKCLNDIRIVAVRLDQIFIAFLMLFIGVGFALIFLIIEILWKKFDLDSKFS